MAKDVKNDLDNYVKIDETKSLENNDFYNPNPTDKDNKNRNTTSNVTGKILDSAIFDYSDTSLTKDHKDAAEEIIRFFDARQDIPYDLAKEELKQNFKLEDVPELDHTKTLWYQFTKDEKLGQQKQGWRYDNVNGKKIKIPHISFSADLDYLDGMINRFVNKVKEYKLLDQIEKD